MISRKRMRKNLRNMSKAIVKAIERVFFTQLHIYSKDNKNRHDYKNNRADLTKLKLKQTINLTLCEL